MKRLWPGDQGQTGKTQGEKFQKLLRGNQDGAKEISEANLVLALSQVESPWKTKQERDPQAARNG